VRKGGGVRRCEGRVGWEEGGVELWGGGWGRVEEGGGGGETFGGRMCVA